MPRPVLAAALSLCALTTACASLRPGAGGPWPLPDPAAAPFQGRRLQAVEIQAAGRSARFLAVLERRGGAVVLAALSPEGRRLAVLRWTRAGVTGDIAPEAGSALDPGLVLGDLSFALWPPEALERAYRGSPFRAVFGPGQRTLRRGGRAVLVVERENGPEGPCLVLRRPGRDGRITVRDLPGEGTDAAR